MDQIRQGLTKLFEALVNKGVTMIEVVAGVIYKNNKFLIAQRNLKKSQGVFWEFTGGKIEPNETGADKIVFDWL